MLITTPTSKSLCVRLQARRGELTGSTANLAPGHVQANLAILPRSLAADFLMFCMRNPRSCPLVGIAEVGDPHIPALGNDLDIRTDVPRYRVWRDGEMQEELTDISLLWRDDLVTFAIGCSFSFEDALIADGIEIRHIASGSNVPMYRTSIPTVKAGPFAGPMVVSMRPMKAADAIRAIQITSRFPSVHGAPVHLGDPSGIGIADLARPDYGDPVEVRSGELPVFWACGVTPQSVIAAMRPSFCITHAPGHMLVTDLRNSNQSVF